MFSASRWMVAASSVALTLAACGGGGSPAPGATVTSARTSLQGTAVDAPIAGAQITITAGAPLGDSGASTVGSVTANATGGFTLSVTLPSGSVPIFANAQDPNNTALILSSYLGSSDILSAAGTLTTNNLPDLDISPVTTAALAVYAQLNSGSYAGLTAAAYAADQQQYSSDILAISAAIKAVGDQLCTPALAVGSTTNLAAAIAAAANLTSGNSTTLATAATTLGGNCPAVLATLPQQISADPRFGPELALGGYEGNAGTAPALPAGTYQLQGLIAETGSTGDERPAAATTASANPARVFSDGAVTISATGTVTSADGLVSGSLVGRLLTLTITSGSLGYSLRGDVGTITAALVSGGTAYALQAGGTNTTSQVLTQFNAVLAPTGAAAVWNGIAAPTTATQQDGASCAAGLFPVRLNGFGNGIGGGSVAECISASASGWTMSASMASAGAYNFDGEHGGSAGTTAPSFSAATWSEVSGASPFILTSPNASFTSKGVTSTGTVYYVMGTQAIVFASTGTGTTTNSLLRLQGAL